MGFRSTMTTEDLGGVLLPKWFVEKWKDDFSFGNRDYQKPPYNKNTMLINTNSEIKFYSGSEREIFIDIQRVCKERDIEKFVAVLLHECGGITRVEVSQNSIRFSEPMSWRETDGVEHDYCYGCSDLPTKMKGQSK